MHTGDLAVMDDDGYVNIVGRIKDMVIRGGENIYPREIEEFLYAHPDIERRAGDRRARRALRRGADGLDPAAARAPTARRRGGPGVLRRARIAHYKIPRYVHVVDEFPMTVTGKVRKVRDARDQRGRAGSRPPPTSRRPLDRPGPAG